MLKQKSGLPRVIGFKPSKLSPKVKQTLEKAENKSEYIRRALEHYESQEEYIEILRRLDQLEKLIKQLTKNYMSLVPETGLSGTGDGDGDEKEKLENEIVEGMLNF